jgi:hypothetical protein
MLSDLRACERGIHSQNGEDGVLERIFECVGTTNQRFVEFGAWDGETLSNTAHLRKTHGWTGLLMEGDPERASELVTNAFVTAENVEQLFAEHGVPEVFDLLSIDIDGNEYWVWRAIEKYRPRVVVIEYNVFFGNQVSKTMPYNPDHVWDESYYHGASLAALRKLGREKGYTLVHTESYAPNAFFVLDSAIPSELGEIERPIEEVSAWAWEDATAEPPIEAGQEWMAV